jgi:putative peptidoglycan lipid II flippase
MSAVASTLPRERSLRRIMTGLVPVSLAVQVLSFASSVALARVLGASTATDAYYLGLAVPALSYGILLAALRLGAIPALTDVAASSGNEGLDRAGGELFSGVLSASVVLTIVVTSIVEMALPLIVGGDLLHMTRVTLLELAPYGVLGAATGVLGAVLAVRGVFMPAVAVLALEPIVKTVLTVGLGHEIGARALIAGNLIGGALAVVVLWRVVRGEGITLRLGRHFDSPFVRNTARLSIPLLVSQSVLLVNPLVDRSMASGFGPGSVTALELGLRLFLVPAGLMTGLLIGPIAATWASRKAVGGWPTLRQSMTRALDGAAAVVPPLVVLGVILRHQFVELVFKGGAYPTSALKETTAVFGMILLSLPAQMLIVIFSTLFIVQKDTIFPMRVAFMNVVLNLALNFAFRALFGVAGIALSTSLTYTILLLAFAVGAHRRWGTFYDGSVRRVTVRVLASVAITATGAALLMSALPTVSSRAGALLVVAAVGLFGLSLHATVLALGRDPWALGAAAQVRRLALRGTR